MQPDLLDDKKNGVFRFLRANEVWKSAIKKRLDTWCGSLTLDFVYDEDMNVNDTIVDTMVDKLEVSPKEREDLLGPALHAKTMLALEQSRLTLRNTLPAVASIAVTWERSKMSIFVRSQRGIDELSSVCFLNTV